jgi:hypothetical protein
LSTTIDTIYVWYTSNGFPHAAAGLDGILREWRYRSHELANAIQRESARQKQYPAKLRRNPAQVYRDYMAWLKSQKRAA